MREVTAAVIFREGKILLARRGPQSKLAGFWEFPGGKVEPGESYQECLERELKEELGIQAIAGEIIGQSKYQYDHGSFIIIAILAEMIGDEIELKVHDMLDWVNPSELAGYELAPADIPLADLIRANHE